MLTVLTQKLPFVSGNRVWFISDRDHAGWLQRCSYSISRTSLRACRTKSRMCARSAIASRVKRPC
jgi:hypothetical protein